MSDRGPDWDVRYAVPEYVFGKEPNEFLASVADRIPAGPVLCLAEGEGRNAVHLARLGHDVTAVEQSAVALGKACVLARERGVEVEWVQADLATYEIAPGAWSGIVSTYFQVPSGLRARVYGRVAQGLGADGVFVLEAYGRGQPGMRTGGPRDPDLLPDLATLQRELVDLEWLIARELERELAEGSRHVGRAAVVQLLGRRRR